VRKRLDTCSGHRADFSYIGGDRMTDEIDQEALMDILVRTEKEHARPTKAVRQQMRESWGWPPDE
jgi:hypothetical protein